MSNEPKHPNINRATPGPKPELLKIKGNWKEAITKSFEKKKPAKGWPQ